MPSITDIQEALVTIGCRQADFIDSKEKLSLVETSQIVSYFTEGEI